MAALLVVDDEKNIRASLVTFFTSLGHETHAAESAGQALAILERGTIAVVLTDYRMAEMNGLELLMQIRRQHPDCLVILMTAYATVENAVAAMKAGAYDYVTKPFSLEQIQIAVERAVQTQELRGENRALRDLIDDAPLLDSRSAVMNRLVDTARRAAASGATILLTGESGTGKNVLARQIHAWSPRHERPFVVINCTTLSEQLLESELFGHVRGSFTGAVKDKPGRLEAADGGTAFLDEIGDLTPPLQTKFLRFVQEQSFERVGGDRTIRVDARIVAASNRDLEAEVAAHRFRDDLYYRLNVIALRVPPLRERKEDIVPLAQWMLRRSAARHRHQTMELSQDASTALTRYDWPGNVRQLQNAIERAAVLNRGGVVSADDLPDSMFRQTQGALAHIPQAASLEELEREHIARVLGECATLEEAAGTLGINVTTLWRKRRRYGIE